MSAFEKYALMAVSMFLSMSSAEAATQHWIGSVNGKWNSSSNWESRNVPASTDTVLFDTDSTGACDVNTNVVVAGLTMNTGFPQKITVASGKTFTIGSSGAYIAAGTFVGGDSAITCTGSFTQAGGTFSCGSGPFTAPGIYMSAGTHNCNSATVTYNGSLNVAGGTYNASSATTTISAEFLMSGTFSHNNGTIRLTGVGKSVSLGGRTVYNLIYDCTTNAVFLSGTANVAGDLTILGASAMNGGTLNCAGNIVTKYNGLTGWSATVVNVNGTGNQSISANGGTNDLPCLTINKPSGTLTISDTIRIINDFTYTAGTVSATSSTISFAGFGKTVSAAGMTFGNVIIDTNTNNCTISGSFVANGNLTFNTCGYFTGSMSVGGNVTSNTTTMTSASGATLTLNGTSDQTIDTHGTGQLIEQLVINKVRCTGGEVKLLNNLVMDNYAQGITVAEGTLNLQGYMLSINAWGSKIAIQKGGILKLTSAATLRMQANSPEAQCGSMIVVSGGSTYGVPSNTTSDLASIGGANAHWKALTGCSVSDTPAACSSSKKVIRWREVPN